MKLVKINIMVLISKLHIYYHMIASAAKCWTTSNGYFLRACEVVSGSHIFDLPPSYKIFATTFKKILDLCRGFGEMILIPPIVHAIILWKSLDPLRRL